jgi:hypothetical protein
LFVAITAIALSALISEPYSIACPVCMIPKKIHIKYTIKYIYFLYDPESIAIDVIMQNAGMM